MPSTHNN